MAGMAKSTLEDWMRDEDGFRDACEVARDSAKARTAAKLFELAVVAGNLGALVWWMKCRDPEFREPREQALEIPGIDEIKDQRDLSRLLRSAAVKITNGQASVAALKDLAETCAKMSEVMERGELEERVAKLEAEQ